MYLRDYLHDIPLKALKSIAKTLEVPVEYGARIKLINAVDRAFWDGTLTERLLEKLPEIDTRVISFLTFSFDAGIHEKELIRHTEKNVGVGDMEVKSALMRLLPLALVGGVKENDNLFFCPKGIDVQVRKILLKDLFSQSDSAYKIPSASPSNLIEDIFSFLAEAYKGKIPLTLMGKIKKTFLDRVYSGSATCSTFSPGITEEKRNSFISDYLKSRGLISYGRRKAYSSEKLSGWLQLTVTERLQDIVSYALKSVLQDEYTIIAFTGIMNETPAGAEFSSSALAQFLHTWTMAPGDLTRLEIQLRDMLSILYHTGLLAFRNNRFIMTISGERLFNGESLFWDESISDFFMVQPNFEVIVGPEIHPATRFKLELLTTRKNRDMVLTYDITQLGITRARERGMDTNSILRFFEQHSRTPIPQNVRFSIEKWAEAYGSIYFDKVTLMRFRDTAYCKSVMHLPDIRPFIKEQLTDTVIVISRDRVSKIIEILKKAGYQPELFGESPVQTTSAPETFKIHSINDIINETKMPAIHSEFIFPEEPFADGES
ncbi:MAG: helicase-associated domain-containing protein [Candidatus Latescibacteria bacterium]|nr:helicase-associated domain-containing protein [Candidatus Latescibacterota bacterium]